MSFDEHVDTYVDSKFKSSKWCMICYTKSMREDWEEALPEIIDAPGFYGLHDMDKDKKGEDREPHIHLSFFWSGNINLKAALNIANRLTAKNKEKCCPVGKPINWVRQNYDYAIHDTDKARSDGKHQYPAENRVCFNGFDIGFYEQLSQVEKDEICWEIAQMIGKRKIKDMETLREIIMSEYDMSWFLVFKGNNAFFDRLCRGVFLKDSPTKQRSEEETESMEAARVAMTEETIVRGRDGLRRVVCKECGKVDTEEAFVTYGGSDGPNIGLCRACSRKK